MWNRVGKSFGDRCWFKIEIVCYIENIRVGLVYKRVFNGYRKLLVVNLKVDL